MHFLLEIRKSKYEKDDNLLFAIKEIGVRKKELGVGDNEWQTIWMLEMVMKRLEAFHYQELINIIREEKDDVLDLFCTCCKEHRI